MMSAESFKKAITKAEIEMAYKLGVMIPEVDEGQDVFSETKFNVMNSEGNRICVQMMWHLELSPLKHVYLTRYDGKCQLHIRTFTQHTAPAKGAEPPVTTLRPSRFGVALVRQQVRDLMHVVWTCNAVVWRNETIDVSTETLIFALLVITYLPVRFECEFKS
jgi:hypothetical protein